MNGCCMGDAMGNAHDADCWWVAMKPPRELHKDPWMMERIQTTLDALEEARLSGLEAELDLLAFAEDVIERYKS